MSGRTRARARGRGNNTREPHRPGNQVLNINIYIIIMITKLYYLIIYIIHNI